MKKYITASLFIFWAITVAVFAAGLVSHNRNYQPSTDFNINGVNQIGNTISGAKPNSTLVLSSAELAKHNSAQSCWLLISSKIYDVTSFLYQHPGNASTILPSCGTDATVAYDTKGSRGKPHSGNANAMLADYYIGNLNRTLKVGSSGVVVPTATGSSNTTQTQPSSTPTPSVIISTPKVTTNTTLNLSSAELAKHNSAQSCWLLISSKIYDVTSFLYQHPGNASTILPSCGTDATVAFATKGGSGSHSSSAYAMLDAYYIGDLNQNITVAPTNLSNSTSTISPTPTPIRNGENDD